MNMLVEHMNKHHNPGARLYEYTRVEIIMDETGWTREEILHMAQEADAAGEILASYSYKGNKWKVESVAEDLITIGTIGSNWKRHHKEIRSYLTISL
jgi:hypothetical protein